jgi:hypothetical protein
MTQARENQREDHRPPLLPLLAEHGLLLQQDKTLPNVVGIVLGETLAASWWTHPRARLVFRCLCELADHADVLQTKLVDGKVTFVHRRLWAAVLAVATAQEPWQVQGLSREGRSLFEQVQAQGKCLAAGKVAKEIEHRLLVHAEQVHSESGAHKTCMETWQVWSERADFQTRLTPREGRAHLEMAVTALGGTPELLPWHGPPRKRR